MGRRIAVAAFAVLLCGAAPGDHPLLRPVHDVDVIYILDAGGPEQTGPNAGGPNAGGQNADGGTTLHERLRWNAATQALRVDPPTAGLYVIIDLAARRMSTVRMADKTVIEMAAPDNVTGMPDSAAADAVRRGEDTVAGLACTEWDMTDAAGEAARLCLTADGVLCVPAPAGGRCSAPRRCRTVRWTRTCSACPPATPADGWVPSRREPNRRDLKRRALDDATAMA